MRREAHFRAGKLLVVGMLPLLTWGLLCCRKQPSPESSAEAPPGSNEIRLLFSYGSEKQKWIEDVTAAFNEKGAKTASGKRITVKAIPKGSGECVDDLISGREHDDLISPASNIFLKLGNAQSRTASGKDLIGPTQSLVLSPVVIAMWKPMAEAIGLGKKPVGWADILALARNQKGWSAYGYPQWGSFKFGHTHPAYSNSGILSLIAENYAATGKVRGLTVADVQNAKTRDFVDGIEASMVHYGSSTGFFGRKLFDSGPEYLSGAVLYESMVVESYSNAKAMPFPVVAIYPKEGTFWSDHPAGIVDRDWVTPERREAAQIYINYLLAAPQQQKALTYGFRPGSADLPVGAPIDAEHGVDPKQPVTTLEVPSTEVISAIQHLWDTEEKKAADIALVLDTSGSMQEDEKLPNAKAGAKQLVSLLSDKDDFSLGLVQHRPQLGDHRPGARDLAQAVSRRRGLALCQRRNCLVRRPRSGLRASAAKTGRSYSRHRCADRRRRQSKRAALERTALRRSHGRREPQHSHLHNRLWEGCQARSSERNSRCHPGKVLRGNTAEHCRSLSRYLDLFSEHGNTHRGMTWHRAQTHLPVLH
jgi:Ca-activated chloride channel family protein